MPNNNTTKVSILAIEMKSMRKSMRANTKKEDKRAKVVAKIITMFGKIVAWS